MEYSFKEIVNKKKRGCELTYSELKWIVNSYTKGQLPDYQMTAFLASVFFKDLTNREVCDLTDIYVKSGDYYSTGKIDAWKADKHSTGGVGDKTTLVFAPLVASYGIKVAKLSGRSLGSTGGTLDKLESFPNFISDFTEIEFQEKLMKNPICIMTTNKSLSPADAKIYALRDVTELVDSLPLIASSIMAKKLVIDANSIVLDVKIGSGAFMKDLDSAIKLSELMIHIGKMNNRNIMVMITDMDKPLGRAIGNALEIKEAIETLQGKGPEDLVQVTVTAVALTLVKAKIFSDFETAKKDVLHKLNTAEAFPYFKSMIINQGGEWNVIEEYDTYFSTKYKISIKANSDGYLNYNNAQSLGILSVELGAGRKNKNDKIDHAAGIYLNKTSSEFVKKNDVVMTLYSNLEPQSYWKEMAYSGFEILKFQKKNDVIKKIITE